MNDLIEPLHRNRFEVFYDLGIGKEEQADILRFHTHKVEVINNSVVLELYHTQDLKVLNLVNQFLLNNEFKIKITTYAADHSIVDILPYTLSCTYIDKDYRFDWASSGFENKRNIKVSCKIE